MGGGSYPAGCVVCAPGGIGFPCFWSSWLITSANAANGLAPFKNRPLMKKAGVPVTPSFPASATSAAILALFFSESRSAVNFPTLRFSSFAYLTKSSCVSAFWFAKSLSWNSQYFP
jgi:hypothetical protein